MHFPIAVDKRRRRSLEALVGMWVFAGQAYQRTLIWSIEKIKTVSATGAVVGPVAACRACRPADFCVVGDGRSDGPRRVMMSCMAFMQTRMNASSWAAVRAMPSDRPEALLAVVSPASLTALSCAGPRGSPRCPIRDSRGMSVGPLDARAGHL